MKKIKAWMQAIREKSKQLWLRAVLRCRKINRKKLCAAVGITALAGAVCVLGINGYVKHTAKDAFATAQQAADFEDADCIIVLGCLVREDGTPSDMLRDRLTGAVELYEIGAAPKILMSGDHGQDSYDEVNAMKQFAVDAGVPSEDVFMDHAGFSTYETMYRAKEIFGAEKVVVVTQKYHLYRAVYIAEQLGMEVCGVSSDYNRYYGQTMRDLREVLARCKDFAMCMIQPQPTFLGDAISLDGDGNVTNDKTDKTGTETPDAPVI